MRLDKYIHDVAGYGRGDCKKKIKAGLVSVNGTLIKDAGYQVKEEMDQVCLEGKQLTYAAYGYYLLHKPAGVICATTDKRHQTVLDLLGEDVPASLKKNLFPVGRLDIDTEGLVLLTNHGQLAHELLSPKKHVEKTYLCHTKLPILEEQLKALEAGVDIGEKHLTKPAKACKIETNQLLLTITEGKFHQVKRMLLQVGNEVVYLKRLTMGPLTLPKDLPLGSYRKLNQDEEEALCRMVEG